jgi:hypothetical protein
VEILLQKLNREHQVKTGGFGQRLFKHHLNSFWIYITEGKSGEGKEMQHCSSQQKHISTQRYKGVFMCALHGDRGAHC